jgi:cold shock CspA family protein
MIGTIVSWFPTRGFGFIRPDDPTDDLPIEIFAHKADTPNSQPLNPSTRVSFEIGKFDGRTKAVKIVVVKR